MTKHFLQHLSERHLIGLAVLRERGVHPLLLGQLNFSEQSGVELVQRVTCVTREAFSPMSGQ